MQKLPLKLAKRLQTRKQENSFRELPVENHLVDFSSNDYLGLSRNEKVFKNSIEILKENHLEQNGATGSRLITGNYPLFDIAEKFLANFHRSEAALIYNSGYDANVGFFSSIPQRGDLIFYDELSHASIREGISGSHAKAFKFQHNDVEDLKQKLEKHRQQNGEVYIVTESIFSMDGDSPDLKELVKISKDNQAHLVIDEAHATGVFGSQGGGLINELQLEDKVFARIHTFGKAIGVHGAVILGSSQLRDYLINFSRSFIYTTAMPPHTLASILASYHLMADSDFESQKHLKENIQFFKNEALKIGLSSSFIESSSAVQSCLLSGNENVKGASAFLRKKGYEVKAILSPTVPKGEERLRFCLHAFNSPAEISEVLGLLATFVAGKK